MNRALTVLAGVALALSIAPGPAAAAVESRYEEGLALYDEAAALRPSDDETFARARDLFAEAHRIWESVPEAERVPALRYHLGMLYYLGAGDVPINQPYAIELIDGAADDGYALADAFIGLLHDKGDGMMVSADPALALARYERAAAGNNCAALKRLAQAYEIGDLGLSPDPERAASLAARIPGCVRR